MAVAPRPRLVLRTDRRRPDDNEYPLAETEIFGPVVTVQGYRDIDDAIAITNDSPYDLSGGVYTNDLNAGLDLAGRIRTGTVQVNSRRGQRVDADGRLQAERHRPGARRPSASASSSRPSTSSSAPSRSR